MSDHCYTPLYGDDVRLMRSLFEFERALCFVIAISIHFSADPDDAEHGLSLATLVSAMRRVGIDAPRRVRRLTEEMRAYGLLNVMPLPGDRRALRLIPTPRALLLDREWLMTFHAPLALLYPDEPRYARAMALEPAYQAAYRRPSLEVLEIANGIIQRNHAFEFFLGQSAGILILAALMHAVRGDPARQTAPGFYSVAAARSGTSRAHVRNVVRAAEAHGLVALSADRDRRVTVLPALAQGYAQWIAESLSSVDWVSAVGCGAAAIEPPWRPDGQSLSSGSEMS